ncbi:hypothetical protein [Propioniciclava soli]|uniref:Uncharacterized protein n=1 Tax=Propioniciclava soli TaxID=2775081 RepID=A0ABZ3C8G0_9ACTN|nr:hypothetical protein [Propioniciclava soli]
MNTTAATTSTTLPRQQGNLRLAGLGFGLGIAVLVVLFVVGAVQGSAQLMVIASSTASALGAGWAAAVASQHRGRDAR